jgi:molybdate transport system substrate-binding protein
MKQIGVYMKKVNYITTLIILALLLTSCSKTNQSEKVLYISAASSLKGPVTEWKKQFEKNHPSIDIKVNFGASGVLINQIKKGAPADLIFSAQSLQRFISSEDQIEMDKKGIIASNELVFVAGKKLDSPVRSLEEIPASSKLGIGDPELVPAGYYAEKALKNVKQIKANIVYSQNAVHLKGLVETGAVDYAIMYRTDALENKRISIIESIPQNWYPAIVYPVYSMQTDKEETEQFLKYVRSNEGQQILKKYNFRESVNN